MQHEYIFPLFPSAACLSSRTWAMWTVVSCQLYSHFNFINPPPYHSPYSRKYGPQQVGYRDTLRCRDKAVNFLQNIHERHPVGCPSGRGMGCLLWVQLLIYILPHFQQWCVQYHVILDRVITTLHCLWMNTVLIYPTIHPSIPICPHTLTNAQIDFWFIHCKHSSYSKNWIMYIFISCA